MPACIDFVVPGSLETRTGGYHYDRRVIEGLAARGWGVQVHALDGSFPSPTALALQQAARVLAAIPHGRWVIIDGLAYGAMPDVLRQVADRLRLVALVHHPLALEGSMAAPQAERLRRLETDALTHARHVIVTSTVTQDALVDYAVHSASTTVVRPGTATAPLAIAAQRAAGFADNEAPAGNAISAPLTSTYTAAQAGDTQTLLTVATLSPRKRHLMLIDALARLRRRRWRLLCVGSTTRDPSAARAVSAAVSAASLDDRVTLLGELSDAELAAHYHAADVFVLASAYEGYGIVYDEALARGLPIIATEGGATADTVPPEAGLVVPGSDATVLADALARWLDDSALRAQLYAGARQARARLRRWDDTVREFAEVLDGLMA